MGGKVKLFKELIKEGEKMLTNIRKPTEKKQRNEQIECGCVHNTGTLSGPRRCAAKMSDMR